MILWKKAMQGWGNLVISAFNSLGATHSAKKSTGLFFFFPFDVDHFILCSFFQFSVFYNDIHHVCLSVYGSLKNRLKASNEKKSFPLPLDCFMCFTVFCTK